MSIPWHVRWISGCCGNNAHIERMSRWEDQTLSQAELRKASVRGGLFNFSAQLMKFSLNIGLTIWLAHLLVPEDFGIVAMAMVLVNFFALFKDAGFSSATIQQEKVTHEQVSLLFWLSAGMGLCLGLILYVSAPVISWFFNEPRLLVVMEFLSVIFIIGGLAIQHESLLRRQMRFRCLAVIELSALMIAAITAVFLAMNGYGYWAMVWMQVIAIAVRVLLLWLWSGWHPSMPALRVGVRRMALFGGQMTVANVIQYLSRQSDQLLLGWYSGAHALGLYSTAMQMMMMPITQIIAPLAQVAQVTLSRVQNQADDFRRTYLLLARIVAYATMPMMAVLAVLAEPVIHLFLGEKWLEAVPLVMLLAVAGWIMPVNNTMGWVLMARAEGGRMLRWNLIMAPLFLTAFGLSLPWGALGMVAAFTSVIYASRYFHFRFVLQGTAISLMDLLGALAWPALFSVLVAATAWGVLQFFSTESLLLQVLLPISGALLAMLLYGYFLLPVRRQLLEVMHLLLTLKRERTA